MIFEAGANALEHPARLDNPFLNLLFADINMSTMLGSFLSILNRPEQNKAVTILLTASLSPIDKEKISADRPPYA